MNVLQDKYVFPSRMTSFLLEKDIPSSPKFPSIQIVEAEVYEKDFMVSISHPAFKFKTSGLYAQYLVDSSMWWHKNTEHAILLLHIFANIIKKHHGQFEVCCHEKSQKWKDLHHQRMADIEDYRECLLHMIDRLGLWNGVFGS